MSTDLIETLQHYVPALIVRRLAADPRPISRPTAERFAAAVLFADITDFTSLADRLSRDDLRGPEELADLLNDYFGRLIEIIHSYGGEVTKFAGDALIALWPVLSHVVRLGPDAETSLAEMAHKATKCGLEIQEALGEYKAADGSPMLLQIGIGAGDIYNVHLGGVLDRWEFLLSGTPLVQMSLAKEKAPPGRVALSPEVWSLVQDSCVGKTIGDGFVELVTQSQEFTTAQSAPLPKLPVEARESLQSYVPAAILSRLGAGHEEWLSEMRWVTVMFIKLPRYGTSIKHPYMRTIPEAQAVMQALQSALYRYAGSINKFNVDDKGITLVAALGLPPLTHADDAARAVHAAMEMQEALESLGRTSAIGITTGWVFCGPVGNELRREYTMVGTVVNMAARLMQAAEERLSTNGKMSNTLCDEATFNDIKTQTTEPGSLAAQLSFRSLQLNGVKGILTPVTAYRPSRRMGASRFPSHRRNQAVRIVGLRAERTLLEKRLRQLVNAAEPPSGDLLIIEGDSGSGKTLLLNELLNRAESQDIRTLVGAGRALEQTTLYHAWRSIFQKMFGIERIYEDRPALRSRVLSQLPPIQGERGFPAFAIRLSPLLNSVLPLDFPENRTTARMDETVRRRTTHQFLLRLIQRNLAGVGNQKLRPTILVFEDGQWLDEPSWRLILDVSQQVRPLLTMVATRRLCEQTLNKRLTQICRLLKRSPGLQWLRLRPLSMADERTLLRQQLDVEVFPEDVLSLLHHKTGGHPVFSLDLARQWRDLGLLQFEDGQCSLAGDMRDLGNLPVPKNTQQIITSRLERLAPVRQLVLKVASVIGQRFSISELARHFPVGIETQTLLAELGALEQLDFIEELPSDSEVVFGFKSDFVRQVALGLLPLSRRR